MQSKLERNKDTELCHPEDDTAKMQQGVVCSYFWNH